MNLTELNQLMKWIEEEIINKQILNKYQELANILQRNIQPNQAQQSFEDQKEALLVALRDVPLHSLSIDQLNFLSTIRILDYIGIRAVEMIEDILYKNVIDLATAEKKVKEIINDIQFGINKYSKLKEGLQDLIPDDELPESKILIRIAFTNEASMNNLVDFKKWGNTWHDIGRGISMANNMAPEDIIIIGAKKGSIVFDLAVVNVIAFTITNILLNARVIERIYDLRKKAEEIRGMKLTNDSIAKSLEESAIKLDETAEKERNSSINKILNKIAKELNIKKKGQGDKYTALENSIKHIINFLDKGGHIDCVIPELDSNGKSEDNNNENDLVKLRESFKEIRMIDNKMKQIGTKTNNKDD